MLEPKINKRVKKAVPIFFYSSSGIFGRYLDLFYQISKWIWIARFCMQISAVIPMHFKANAPFVYVYDVLRMTPTTHIKENTGDHWEGDILQSPKPIFFSFQLFSRKYILRTHNFILLQKNIVRCLCTNCFCQIVNSVTSHYKFLDQDLRRTIFCFPFPFFLLRNLDFEMIFTDIFLFLTKFYM